MKIKKLKIKNFKSLVDVELINPNPFSVFVGPNASGKSNIFEAIQFFRMQANSFDPIVINKFGGFKSLTNFKSLSQLLIFDVDFGDIKSSMDLRPTDESGE